MLTTNLQFFYDQLTLPVYLLYEVLPVPESAVSKPALWMRLRSVVSRLSLRVSRIVP